MLNSVYKLKRFLLGIFIIGLTLSSLLMEVSLAKEIEGEQFRTAAKAFSDQFYDASLSLFERFIGDFPESPLTIKAKLYLAKCHYYKQDYRKALKILSDIETEVKSDGISDELFYWLGVINFKGRDFDKAVNYTKRVVDNYPDSEFRWPSYYLLGQSFQEGENPKAAKKVFSDIVEKATDSEIVQDAYLQLFPIYLKEKNHSQLIALGREYFEKFSRSQEIAKVYFYLAENYYTQAEWDKAEDYYQRGLRGHPDPELLDLIYQRLGFTYIEKDNSFEAKISIDRIKDKELRLFSQGAYYFRSKDFIQALETFNMFIRDYPQGAHIQEVYLNKADVLYELGRLNDAVYTYRYILNNSSRSDNLEVINKAHYGLAWSYLKSGKFKKAIEEFKDTLEYASNPVVKASSQIHIADAYQEMGKYVEALNIYNDILTNYPNTIYADYIQFQIGLTFLKKKDLEKAFMALNNLKNNFSSSKLVPQAQYYLAVGYFSQEDYFEAKSLLEDFIDKFPNDDLIAKAYYLQGKCFFNEKDYQRALRIFKEVVAKFHDRDIEELSYVDLGITYLHLSLNEAAKKTWVQFLKKYPQSEHRASVILYLGGLYEKESNFIEAEKKYRQVLRDYQDSSWGQEARLALGHLYWNRDDLETAEEHFKALAKENVPAALKSKLYLAKVYSQGQKHEEALAIYEELIDSKSPITKIAFFEKAFLLKEMKLYSEAIVMFNQAIVLDVDSPELRFSLGICLEKTGKLKDAVEQYLKVIYNFPEDNDAAADPQDKGYRVKSFFRVARIYERDNNLEEAKKVYQKIIDLGIEESKIAQVRLEALKK